MFNRSDVVIATLVASSCVAAICSFVVLSQVADERIRLFGPSQVQDADETAAAAPARRYPEAEASGALTLGPAFDDATPAGRDAPRLALPPMPRLAIATPSPARPLPPFDDPTDPAALSDDATLAALDRPEIETGVIQLAASMTLDAARALPAPRLRPETVAARAAPDAPTAPDTDAADAASILLVAVSPRPIERPGGFAARVPARATPTPEAEEAAEEEVMLAAYEPEEPRQLISPRSGANPCSPRLADIPRRRGSADGGSVVMASLMGQSGGARDNVLLREALSGNVPTYLRELQPVRFTGVVGGRQTEITICVTPDYLSIGSDSDNVRVPLGLPAALRVAEAFDMMLPTTRMVDAIYAQADLRLSPQPMTPGPQMSTTDYFLRHDATLDGQFARAGGRGGILVAGHKKDLVLANRLSAAPGRVAIYGWHRGTGSPIQPLSTVHGEYYADYSHGIRLVSRTAYVNGRAVDLRSLLTDGQYAGLLNSDGPLNSATVRLASL